MGENDKMAENPPESDDEDNDDAAGAEESALDGNAEGVEDPNFAGLSAQLRGLYKGLLDEPIPDRFAQLLKELESKEAETK